MEFFGHDSYAIGNKKVSLGRHDHAALFMQHHNHSTCVYGVFLEQQLTRAE